MTDEDENGATASYVVNDGAVFNKLIITTLKYVPVVLAHHIPYKEVSGRYKLPTQSAKFTALQRPIQAYYANLHRLLRTLPDPGMLYVVLTESAKMVPWLLHNRKVAREHVKILLDLWATANDKVRIAAFLSIRKIAAAGDEVLLDLCLKVSSSAHSPRTASADAPRLTGRVPKFRALHEAHDGAHAAGDQPDEEQLL